MSCTKCGRGLFLPLPEMTPGGYDLTGGAPVCNGCQLPEHSCDCDPIRSSSSKTAFDDEEDEDED